MATGATPSAMAASALPQPHVTTRVGVSRTSVSPKACSMVTGNPATPDALALALALPLPDALEPEPPPQAAATTARVRSVARAASRRRARAAGGACADLPAGPAGGR